MKNVSISRGLIAALLACSAMWMVSADVHAAAPAGKATAATNNSVSPSAVYNMYYRYSNKSQNCPPWPEGPADYQANAATYPEYMCTGIILRATSKDKEPNGAWVPEDKSLPTSNYVSAGGMSFSYIRTDTKFDRLAFSFNNGFTLLPLVGKYAAPPDKYRYTVLCAYPVDGSTDYRLSFGCGPYSGNANTTSNVVGGPIGDTCQNQKITVSVPGNASNMDKFKATIQGAQNWRDKTYIYNNNDDPGTRGYQDQCGFQMTDFNNTGVKIGVTDFSAMLMAMKPTFLTDQVAGTDVNELRLKTWQLKGVAEGNKENMIDEATLPIESFFYVSGTPGLADAQFDQTTYYQRTNQFIPIVEITLPKSMTDDFQFAYHSADQKVPVPQNLPPHPVCKEGQFDTKC